METKKRITPSDAVSKIRNQMPPGTTLRRVTDGVLYVIGVKHGRSDYWMMRARGDEKGVVPALQIISEFEIVRG